MSFLSITLRGLLVTSLLVPMASPAFAETTVDTSLLNKTDAISAPDFALQQFSSCANMRDKIADFMELYYTKYPYYGHGGIMYDKGIIHPVMSEQVAAPTAMPPSVGGGLATDSANSISPANPDHSTTNSRTVGVDEPEKVKTDGRYLYTARVEDKAIYINKADDSLELLTKIMLPQEYTSAELFVEGNKMVVVAGKYFWNESFANAWIDRSNKAIVIVYDISNIQKPLIERYSQIDGYVSEARLTNGKLTVMTSTSFNFPVERYMPRVKGAALELDMTKLSSDFSTKNVLPTRIEFRSTKTSGSVETAIANARKSNRLVEKSAVDCQNISYVLPNKATLENYNFNPSFTTITQIDVRNPAKITTSSMMFGDVGKAYLAASGKLYITSSLYTQGGGSPCPPGAMCLMRWIEPGTQTIIHQFDTTPARAKYLRTGIVPGSLISDYAIDENAAGEVRLVTQKTGTSRESQVYVLNNSLGKISELTGLGKDENFQSSRFIGNRLYLVTFKQTDPLFVIDLADSKNPKVLGELKIPGYSTYLHPYDNDRLIGIGYDTKTNQWGGTVNSGIKVDLYNVADVANPKQEATLTLGGVGSYSDALSNPRLFVWQKSKNTLYLPAQLNTSLNAENPYSYSDVFQGVVALKIDAAASGAKIKETGRVTHLEWDDAALTKKRDEECKAYAPKPQPVCRKLVTGEEVCGTSSTSTYVPEYCYADAGLGAYKANSIWNQNENFIDRVMYSGDRTFTFSRLQIRSYDNRDGLTKMGSVILGKSVPDMIMGTPYVK